MTLAAICLFSSDIKEILDISPNLKTFGNRMENSLMITTNVIIFLVLRTNWFLGSPWHDFPFLELEAELTLS